MRVQTVILVRASVREHRDKVLRLPIGALFFVVLVQLRLSSEVLPIVGVHAFIPLVVGLVVRAPNSLEVEQIEVLISFHHVQ